MNGLMRGIRGAVLLGAGMAITGCSQSKRTCVATMPAIRTTKTAVPASVHRAIGQWSRPATASPSSGNSIR